MSLKPDFKSTAMPLRDAVERRGCATVAASSNPPPPRVTRAPAAMSYTDLIADIFAAFSTEGSAFPPMTLRGGDALDADQPAPPFDVLVDAVSDEYLESHPWGSGWLDAASWRHYLPFMMEYALRHVERPSDVTDALLTSFRPPDRDPPRLGSLNKAQETVVLRFLDVLAHTDASASRDLAAMVLSEWWTPGEIPKDLGD
jgi:hypothetical protein